MKKLILICTLLFCFAFAIQAQNGERLEAQRIAFITNRLNLSPQEAQGFWPVYNQYKKEGKELKKSLKRPGPMKDLKDEEIEAYLDASLNLEEKELALKRKYFNELKSILPVRKIAKLVNAERAFTKMVVERINERRQNRRGNND